MDKYLIDKKYWEKRASRYDKLQWAGREEYIKAFIDSCEPDKEDTVLDLGTGTGTIAYAIAPKVKNVVGIDISGAMLNEAQKHNHTDNVEYMKGDVRGLPFLDNSFTLVTARMIFHYLLAGLNRAVKESYRVLKPGGSFCLSEGVPPDKCVKDFYREIFELKEKRLTFFPEDLEKLHKNGGFNIGIGALMNQLFWSVIIIAVLQNIYWISIVILMYSNYRKEISFRKHEI